MRPPLTLLRFTGDTWLVLRSPGPLHLLRAAGLAGLGLISEGCGTSRGSDSAAAGTGGSGAGVGSLPPAGSATAILEGSDAGNVLADAAAANGSRQCPATLGAPPVPAPAPDRTSADLDARVRGLIKEMTREEKVLQLDNTAPAIERLNLPAYQYWNEALHGVCASGATSFPVPLALGATWDPELIHEVATAISDEARAIANTRGGTLTFFSPTINISRDPRWGRAEETYGEDPYLLSRMTVAFITGMQGDDPKYLKTVATAKHFLANNHEAGRYSTSSDVDVRALREFYTPHFRVAVAEARVYSVMAAYNAVNGVPMVDNPLLSDLLRQEWGFGGYVVSDCGALSFSASEHGYAPSFPETAAWALAAGTDLECVWGNEEYPLRHVYANDLLPALDQGLVSDAAVDEALFRVLRGRFLLGEFDPPESVPFRRIEGSALDSEAHRELARRAAQESLVLLRNTSSLLPLDANIASIAVLGPYADRVELGGYSGTPTETISVLAAIRQRLTHAEVLSSTAITPAELGAVAAQADAAVVVLGTDLAFAREGLDAPDLELPQSQEELARAAVEANPKTVVVLMAGHPVTFPWLAENAPALLYGWYLGQAGGLGVTDVLFGEVNPAGRLPLTLYASTDQLPSITNYGIRGDDSEGIGRTYLYFDEAAHGSVLYPFGHGLSYATFAYDDLDVCLIDPMTAVVSLRVTNQGNLAGDEVVQLYVRDTAPGVLRPLRSLRGFSRISIGAGESKPVAFRLEFSELGYWDEAARGLVVAPGELHLEVGASSRDIRLETTIRTDGAGFLL